MQHLSKCYMTHKNVSYIIYPLLSKYGIKKLLLEMEEGEEREAAELELIAMAWNFPLIFFFRRNFFLIHVLLVIFQFNCGDILKKSDSFVTPLRLIS